MRTFFASLSLMLVAFLLFAFKSGSFYTSKSDLVGFWVIESGQNTNVFTGMKVFEKDGSYYNVAYENGSTLMALKGKYKVLDDSHYKEKVTNVRFNAQWDLKDKEFINTYELSKDKKRLVLSGVVYSRNGMDSLKWSETYRKVEIPE